MEMLVAVEEQQIAVQAAMLEEDGAEARFDDAQANYNEWAAVMEEQELTTEEQQAFDSLQTTHEEYTVVAQELFAAKQNGDTERAEAKMDELEPLVADMRDSAHTLENTAVEDKKATVATADATTQTARRSILGLTVGAFIAAIGI